MSIPAADLCCCTEPHWFGIEGERGWVRCLSCRKIATLFGHPMRAVPVGDERKTLIFGPVELQPPRVHKLEEMPV